VINIGDGDNRVRVKYNLLHGAVSVNTGDFAAVDLRGNTIQGDLVANSSGGGDWTSLRNYTLDGSATIDTGDGNDEVCLGNPVASPGLYPNTFNSDLTVNGGAGSFDALYHELLDAYAVRPASSGFETVFP
jgi:hypothetical protein